MSSGLEAKIDDVFVALLAPAATAAGLPVVKRIADETLEPNRIAVNTKDLGEDRAVKHPVTKAWGRKLRCDIVLKTNAADKSAAYTEATASAIFDAIQTPAIDPAWAASFQLLSIQEIAESDLNTDKRSLAKAFVVILTALPS